MAVGVVSLSGTTTQNQTLAMGVVDADGLPSNIAIAYVWQQSFDNGLTWTDIAGATDASLILTQTQVGSVVRGGASYTDAAGSAEQVFSASTSAAGNVNNVGVASVIGSPIQGQVLTARVDDLDGLANASITYNWQQLINGNWSNIANATAGTYVLQAAQVGRQVRVRVTYTDQLGGTETNRASAATPVVLASNPNGNDVGVVTVNGTATQNQLLAASVTDADGIPAGASINYQWQLSADGGSTWSDIVGATSRSLDLLQAQVGKLVRVVASYTDGAGNLESVASAATAAIGNVNDAGAASVNGTQVVGQTLRAAVSDADGLTGITITYRWQQLVNGTWTNIANATSASYTLQSAQFGRQVRVLVSYTDQLGGVQTNLASAATPAIVSATNRPGSVGVTGTPTQNQVLTATVSDADGVPAAVTYLWQQSQNGTTWSNIAGATSKTFTLGQAQVGNLVRAIATYTDLLGSAETTTSAATAAVANVNDIGTVNVTGTPTQGQTLTATVNDVDGVPASISYLWQQSPNGTTWSTIAGATSKTFTLGPAQVGNLVRAIATYTDLLGGAETATSAATAAVGNVTPTSLFTTQTPAQPNFTDGPAVDWELGMRFTSDVSGTIQAIRYYKSSGETGTHTGEIWSSTGQVLATITFTNETGSGWQLQTLVTPLTIQASTTYVVSVNSNNHYAVTSQGFASPISNGVLHASVGAGVYNETVGAFPNLVFQNENYFRDVVFLAGSSNPVNHPGSLNITGTPTQNQVLTATVSDADGVPAAITYLWQQSQNGTTWSDIAGATSKTFTLGQAQVGNLVRAIATYTDLLGSAETATSAATAAVANVNDIGTVNITGTPTQNQVLTATVNDVDGVPASISYLWQQSQNGTTWSDIAGATSKTFTLGQAQVGNLVRAIATYTDLLGSAESVTSAATATIAAAGNSPGSVGVTGTPTQNQVLTATVSDADGVPANISYLWQQSQNGTTWSNIAGATSSTFTLGQAQVGNLVRAIATYTDLLGSAESVTSAATVAVANVNDTGAVVITGTPTQNQVLTATVSDADGVPAAVTYLWQQSQNGTTWSNIAGATSKTFTLGQAQVGNLVRAIATYTDLLGSAETTTSAATAAVANVNDIGTVNVTGTPTQGQTLTATVNDVDGVPASISYLWQQSPNGTTWSTIAGATSKTFTLGPAQVGNLVRAIATYTDLLGGAETATSAATAAVGNVTPTSLFTTQTPAQPNFTDGPAVDWELGMRFTSDVSGTIQAIRYYKSSGETGTHTGEIWSSTGQVLATITFTNETGSGWQLQTLVTPLTIQASTTYVVSVNSNNHYAVTSQGFASPISNGVLHAGVGAGVYNETVGAFPNLVFQNENYFRDVVFLAGSSNPVNHPGSLNITGTPTQNQVLTATVSDADGVPASISYLWQQSQNGTTWSNIAGATSKTFTLGQAQVGNLVRAIATYTDLLGSAETATSAATAAVANVNDTGTVNITGTPTQNQVLTATVNDVDGVPASISYLWQQSQNGTTWSNIAGTTGSTFTLGPAQVGNLVRAIATYTDLLGSAESVTSAATAAVAGPNSGPTSLFTTQTPAQPNFTDGPAVDWELGMRFTSDVSGAIQAIRYYKSSGETGTHVGQIWSSTGQILATITFTNETGSGWQQQTLATPLTIQASTTYVVSVNSNNHYAVTSQGFASPISNGVLHADVGAGIFSDTVGVFPSLVYQNENYFRDVVFTSSSIIALESNATVYVSEAAGTATLTVIRAGGDLQSSATVEYTVNEIGAGSAQAGQDFLQPNFDGRPNTGQVVFAPGESSKSFTVQIVDDQLTEGSETFAVGIQNPGTGSLGVPRTVLVTIVDDDAPTTIAMANAAVTVAEGVPTATLTLLRSGNYSQAATVAFATSNGSALAGSDYTTASGTVTFAPGQVTRTISIPVINDTLAENDESFTVTLSNPTGAVLGNQVSTTVSILDNDNLGLGSLVRQTYASGLSEPSAIDWTPDGRYMVVAQKGGIVRVVENGVVRSTPLIDLSNEVNTAGDRGILGIAVNPNFASNPYIYLLYTYDPPETAGRSGAAAPDQDGNRPSRLVRITVDPATMIADPASKFVLVGTNSTWAYTSRPDVNSNGDVSIPPSGIVNGTTIVAPANQIEVGTQDNDPTRAGIQNQNIRDYLATDGDSHSIGAVHFGPDGYLYLAVGDGSSYNFADPRAVRVQDVHNLSGKILRIDPATGAGAPDNPFYQPSDPFSNQSKVFYLGVRNAYRFSFDPVTNLPVLGDVGWNSWEEINTGPPGSNFGWPYLEGSGQTASYQDLSQAIAFYNNGNRNSLSDQPAVFPILSRSHGAPDGAAAITAGDFYNQNTVIFDDVLNGNVYAATLDASRHVTNVQLVDSGAPGMVDLQKGPDGAIYAPDIYTGTIARWVNSSQSGSSFLAAPSL